MPPQRGPGCLTSPHNSRRDTLEGLKPPKQLRVFVPWFEVEFLRGVSRLLKRSSLHFQVGSGLDFRTLYVCVTQDVPDDYGWVACLQ